MRLVNRVFLVTSTAALTAAGLLAQTTLHAGGPHAGFAPAPAAHPLIYGIGGPAPVGGVGPAPTGGVGRVGPSPLPGRGYRSAVPTPRGNGFAERGRYERNRGWGLPFAYFLTPYYYPDWGYDAAYDAPAPANASAQTAAIAEERLGDQIQKLSAEIEELRNAQQQNSQPDYAPAETAPAPQSPSAPPIVLVLRDGQQLKIDSYAVMNNTLWDFSKQPARRIPISTINVPASEKATEANGAEFPQISTP